MKKMLMLSVVLILILALVGCDTLTGLNSGSGELAMFIADAPVNDAVHVFVTLDKVEVHNVDTGWELVNDFDSEPEGELTVDLLKLRFDEKLLGQPVLPAGTYDQIRLYVATDEAPEDVSTGLSMPVGKSYVEYYDTNGVLQRENIFIPSGTQTGLKIEHTFTIEEGVITRLLLDNDVSDLLVNAGQSGLIILSPTAIKVIDQVISGDIAGQVLADNDGDPNTAPEALTENDVAIEAIDNSGVVVASTVASTNSTTIDGVEFPAGSFLIRGLPEGTYTLRAYVVDDTGTINETMYSSVEEPGISVTAGEKTTLTSPLVLPLVVQ